MFRGFIDKMREAPNKKIRKRIIRNDDYCKDEKLAPSLAPRWTRVGYEGRLKDAVIESIEDDGYDADYGEKVDEEGAEKSGEEKSGEEAEKEEETVLLSSKDQHIDNSDDEHLEMDDGFKEP